MRAKPNKPKQQKTTHTQMHAQTHVHTHTQTEKVALAKCFNPPQKARTPHQGAVSI